MYNTIKDAINKVYEDEYPKNLTFEEAYEKLYRLTSRLADMDDFSTPLLRSMKSKLDSGKPFNLAFAETVDAEYEFANFDYFKDAFIKYHEDLEEALNKAVESRSPSTTWNTEINWMFDHAVIDVNGTDYTLKQLQKEVESKGDEY